MNLRRFLAGRDSTGSRLAPVLAGGRVGLGGAALLALMWLAAGSPLSGLDPTRSVLQYNIRNWSRQNGLPADKVNSVAQSSDGFIWLGTQRGLIRFDGTEFTTVTARPEHETATEVSVLAPARAGGVFVVYNQGGFARYDGRKFHALEPEQWPKDGRTANAVLEARDGAIWIGTNLGVGRVQPGRPGNTLFDQSAVNVFVLCEDARGDVWMATMDGALFKFAGGRLTRVPVPSLEREAIRCMVADENGDVWIGTSRGLRCIGADGQLKVIPAFADKVLACTALCRDRHGVLWIGTSGYGLLRYHDGKLATLQRYQGLGSDFVSSIIEDAEGSLWVGLGDGVSLLNDVKFPIIGAPEGLPDGAAHTVTASRSGGLWVASATGVAYFDGEKARRLPPSALPANPYIKLGFEARNGDYYIVDPDRTINVVSGDRIVARYTNPDRWPEALAEDDDGMLVGLATELMRIKDGKLEPYRFNGQRPDFGYIDNMTVARDGAIWVATFNGVFRVKDGSFRRWSQAEGLPVARVNFVLEDEDGGVWICQPSGLVRIKGETLAKVSEADGLTDNRIYAIVPDNLGYFWIDSGRGIYRVQRRQLVDFAERRIPRVHCESFDGADGVVYSDRTDQENSGCRTPDGRVWFPNQRGVVMIDPAGFFRNQVAPMVHLDGIRVDGREVDDPAAWQPPVGVRHLEFSFSALSYLSGARIRVRYQLDGVDPTWVTAEARRSAQYSGLSPGRYTFRVQAANSDGVWNTTGAAYTFVLPPAFYQTIWFYLGCVGAAGVLLFGAYRWKLGSMQRQQARLQAENDALEAKVTQRTDELARSLSLQQATIDSTADGILAIDLGGRIVSANRQFAAMWGLAKTALASEADAIAAMARQVKDEAEFRARLEVVHAQREAEAFDVIELTDGRTIERYSRPQRIDERCVGIVMNFRDVTARRQAEQEIALAHRRLVEVSRHAGMAEVATGVLHNVGNVLNSVNVAATVAADQLRTSKIALVQKLAGLIAEHEGDLATFLTQDPRGRQVPSYLRLLSEELGNERATLVRELDHLRSNVEHIKEIVAMQQSYANVSGLSEATALADIVEDAIRINANALARHGVEVVRDFQDRPVLNLERHKVTQILVNLISNAKDACAAAQRADRKVIVRVERTADRVRVSVIDNGEGIAAENLRRIFEFGFTTKKTGHGFGLHSGANAAKEAGGSLSAASAGPGMGATFTLELPTAGENGGPAAT